MSQEEDTALFDNNQQLEESQTFIAELLHKLDVDKAVDDAMEVKFMISNMEGILGQFSETSYELQHEINDILESSKAGLLTHDKLSEMIAMEQTRSNCVNGIVNSLRGQIEHLFQIITEAMNNPDDDGSAMNQLQVDMGMMMKSVDSLSTVITSPTKKLDMAIKKIDSELIVHLNDQYKYSESWAVKRGKSKAPKVQARKQKQIVGLDAESEDSSDEEEVTEMVVEDTPVKEKKSKKKKPSPLAADDGSSAEHTGKTPKSTTHAGEHVTPTNVKKLSSRANSLSANLNSPHVLVHAPTAHAPLVMEQVEEAKEEIPVVAVVAAPKEPKEKKAKKGGAKHGTGKKKGGHGHHGGHGGHHAEKHHDDDAEEEEEEPEEEHEAEEEVEETTPPPSAHVKHKKHTDPHNKGSHGSSTSVGSKNSDHHSTGGNSSNAHHKEKSSVRRGSKEKNISSNSSVESDHTVPKVNEEDDKELKVSIPGGEDKHTSASSSATAAATAASTTSKPPSKPRPAPLHKVGPAPRGSRPTSPANSVGSDKALSPHSGEHAGKTPDHASMLLQIQMKNRENALLEREKALERRIAENDKVIDEKVADMLEAKKQFENRLKKSLSSAGYIKKEEVIQMIDKKEKARRMLRSSVSETANGEISLSDCFDNTDLMEMIVNSNPDLTPEEVIQKILDLFNNPNNSPQFRKAIILSLMTGDPMDLEAAEELYQAVEEKLVEEVVQLTHNEEDAEHIRQHLYSPGGTHRLPSKSTTPGRSKPGSRSFDMRNGTPYMTGNDFIPLNVVKEQQLIGAQIIMTEIANSNRRNEVTDELYGTAFKNLQKSGNLARVEAIKIVAPYNNETITCQATSTEDLAEFVASQVTKKIEDLPKIITDGGVSGFMSELEDLSVASPTQLNLAAVQQTTSTALSARTIASGRMMTDRLDTPAVESRSELATVKEGEGSAGGSVVGGVGAPASAASQPMFEQPSGVQGKSVATTGGETFIFYGGTVETPLHSTSRVISSPEVKGLPVFDNKYDMLLTRTYQPQPHMKTFNEFLEESDNPLYTLFMEYQGNLSRLQKIRLASAALTENKVATDFATNAPVRQLVSSLLSEIIVIAKECDKMLSAVHSAEMIVSSLVALLKASKAEAVPIISNSVQVHELFRQYGEIEACKIGVDLQMHEFRALFERINAISIHELANTMKESADFSNCYKYYLSCQGQVLEIHQRLMSCKDRCDRYKLIKHETNAQRAMLMQQSMGSPNQDSQAYFNQGLNENMLYQENQQLREELEILQMNLETADDDIADLEEELHEVVKEKDRAPSALLFFTLLHDPAFIQTLQQLVLQLSQLRPFADGNTTHIDFITMKKRIQVCIVCIPGVEKLLNYYSTIYGKWATHRNNWFVSRSVTGGAADNLATCPLCYNDLGKDRSKDVEAAMMVTKPARIRVSRKQMRANALNHQHQQHQQQQMLMSSSQKNLRSKLPHI